VGSRCQERRSGRPVEEKHHHDPRPCWHNYACLGDVVSHEHDFERDFFTEMKRLKLFPKHRAIDYSNLHNPFEVVSHGDNRGSEKRNPHKSYGYPGAAELGYLVGGPPLGAVTLEKQHGSPRSGPAANSPVLDFD
jgi:hypothetical protein